MTAPTAEVGWRRYLPILSWLPSYRADWLRPDLVAALTVWALVVPQAIAYAQIAGLPPQAGLFATAAGLVGYALLGTSRQLIVSPTSSTAAISASLVGVIALGDTTRSGELSSLLAILTGIALVVLGLSHVGFVARFIPTAVQVGFMFGLGLTIIVGQTAKILGVPDTEGSFIDQVRVLLGNLSDTNPWTLLVGGVSLAVLLLARRFAPGMPAALVVVVASIAAVAIFGLDERNVEVLGLVEGGLPVPVLPTVLPGDFLALVPGAIAIAVVGSAEGLTVAQQFADEHRTEIRPDQELIANGGANVLSGLFAGFIVGGGASQSAANDRAGARTPLVSLVVSALTVATCVAFLPLFQDLPQAVLGAIVISAVLGFLRVRELERLRALRTEGFALAVVALVATLALGILPGLITSVILALLTLLVRLARPRLVVLGRQPGTGAWVARDRHPGVEVDPVTLVLRLEAPLLFLNAGLLRDLVRAQVAAAEPRPQLVVLELGGNSELDIEGMDILERLASLLAEDGVTLRLGGARQPVHDLLERARARGAVGLPADFRTVEEAVTGRAIAQPPTMDEPMDMTRS